MANKMQLPTASAWSSAIAISAQLLLSAAAVADTFALVTGDDYPPFTGTDLPNQGLSTEIVQSTFRHMGHDTTVEFKPWKRGYQDALDGKYLGTFPYGENPTRLEEFGYSIPLYEFGQYFFARSDSPVTFDRDQDLQGLRVCLPLGYNPVRVQEMVDQGIVTMDRPPDLESCFRMLDLGRTDLVRVNDIIGWTMIDRLFETRTAFRMIEKPVRESIEHLIVSKTYPNGGAILQEFNDALRDLQQQGTIQEIVKRHLE